MAFVKWDKPEIGQWVKTTQLHESLEGFFQIGTKVKVIGITDRGYDIEDKYGNRICEIGWLI